MRQRTLRIGASLLLLALVVGCAARGARDSARISALTVGEAALQVDALERQLYAENIAGYTKGDHDKVGQAILKLLFAARAYERTIAAWPAQTNGPLATVEAVRSALNVALIEVASVLPQVEAVRSPLNKALAAVRAALEAE